MIKTLNIKFLNRLIYVWDSQISLPDRFLLVSQSCRVVQSLSDSCPEDIRDCKKFDFFINYWTAFLRDIKVSPAYLIPIILSVFIADVKSILLEFHL